MDPSQPGAQMPPPRPKNWLVESILVTIFCCIPLGIGGIVNAASVNSKYNSGNYAGASDASKQAGKWTKTGFWIGLAIYAVYAIFLFVNHNKGLVGMPG